jgi:hypothetical protein
MTRITFNVLSEKNVQKLINDRLIAIWDELKYLRKKIIRIEDNLKILNDKLKRIKK